MKTTKDPSKLLRLRAEAIRLTLPDLCRREKRSIASLLRVARIFVDEEDLDGKASQDRKPAIKAAMTYHRCLRQAEEPDYPETARRRHLDQNENFEKFLADLKDKRAKSGKDGRPV